MSMKAQGWFKIREAVPFYTMSDGSQYETFVGARAHCEEMADLGYPVQIDGEYVELLLEDGHVELLAVRRGENAKDLAAHYRARGWTDARCTL